MTGVRHAPKQRLAAEAMLLVGHTPEQVQAELGISATTVRRWSNEPTLRQRLADAASQAGPDDASLFLDFLRTALRSMTTAAEQLGDRSYLQEHNPQHVAVAMGILGDKLVGVASTAQALGLRLGQPGQPRLTQGRDT